jgi:hypothetical protein
MIGIGREHSGWSAGGRRHDTLDGHLSRLSGSFLINAHLGNIPLLSAAGGLIVGDYGARRPRELGAQSELTSEQPTIRRVLGPP